MIAKNYKVRYESIAENWVPKFMTLSTHCKPKDANGNLDPSDKVAMGLIVSTAACALGIKRPPAVVVPPSAAAATPAC